MAMRMHGANPEKVFEYFGMKVPDIILDFSTNTNVVPYLDKPQIDWWSLVSQYPDDECLLLRKRVADQEKVDLDQVMFFNGSNEAIYQILSLVPNGRGALLQPLYGEYEKAMSAYDYHIQHLYHYDQIFDLRQCDYLFICNPNNPTGQVIEGEVLNFIVKHCQEHKITLVIDEAYHFFLEQKVETAHWIKENDYLIILRSLTKAYGLSGIRLGYCLGNNLRMDSLKKIHPTWSVNGVAQALGIDFLNNTKYLDDTRSFYAVERRRVVEKLQQLGYATCPSQVNYFLMPVKHDEKMIRFLLKKGIVVRHTRNFKSLDGQYIRVAVKSPSDNDAFLDALKEFKLFGNKD